MILCCIHAGSTYSDYSATDGNTRMLSHQRNLLADHKEGIHYYRQHTFKFSN